MRNALLAGNIPVLLVALSALGACNSDYRSKVELPEDCDRQWFYEDQDGDGWGRPGGNAELLCTADTTDGVLLTARNDLDCDDGEDASSDAELDAAADVTGRVAAICPDELVLGGASTHAFQAAGSEFAAVMPTLDYGHVGQTDPDVTELVSATGAEAACGANGWGGELATFDNLTELAEVTDVLDGIVGDQGYAAFIGLVPDGSSWRWVGKEAGAGLQVTEVGFCNDVHPLPEAVASNPGLHMALVKPIGGDWCFGFPTDANPDAKDPDSPEDGLPTDQFFYRVLYANFVCEREPPLPGEHTVDRGPEEG